MSEKRFELLDETIFDNQKQAEDGGRVTYWIVEYQQRQELVDLLNEQQATIEEYEDFCLNLCKFLIGKGLVDEYREEYGKEYKIITKWKGCGSDE